MKASVVIARMCRVIHKHGDVDVHVFPQAEPLPECFNDIVIAYRALCERDSKTANNMVEAFKSRITIAEFKTRPENCSKARLKDL